MNSNDLKQLKNLSYDELNVNTLPDLSSVIIDIDIPICERIQNYCDSIKNPYFLKAGKTIVEVKFSENKCTIENKIKEYLKRAGN